MKYVWYAGYGSNLCEERFLCYIKGGKFRWGGRKSSGCDDKTLPEEKGRITIPFPLYFAERSRGWQGGGVAFSAREYIAEKREPRRAKPEQSILPRP